MHLFTGSSGNLDQPCTSTAAPASEQRSAFLYQDVDDADNSNSESSGNESAEDVLASPPLRSKNSENVSSGNATKSIETENLTLFPVVAIPDVPSDSGKIFYSII